MKIHFGYLLAIAAVSVAGCAAFFSVYGLSQLFAGASFAVILMASALEFSKIVSASFLHKYWDDVSRVLKIYLTVGVIVLVTITSAGIYGFLSSAYQKTAANYQLHTGEISVLDSKIIQFQSKIDGNKTLIQSRTSRIDQLNGLRTNQENRLSDSNTRVANATRGDIKSSNSEIKDLNISIDNLNVENNKLMDSIGKYNVQKLEKSSSSKVAGEVGPLKYLADLTGKPMDVVVNYFILLLVFVFDPLAIALVIGTTWVFEKKRVEELEIIIEENDNKMSDELHEELKDMELAFQPSINTTSEVPKGIDVEDELLKLANEEFMDGIYKEGVLELLKENQPEDKQLELDFDSIPEEIPEPEIIDDSVHEEEIPEPVVKKIHFEPVIPTGKVEIDEIKEVKERGFSVPIPEVKKIDLETLNNNPQKIIVKRNN